MEKLNTCILCGAHEYNIVFTYKDYGVTVVKCKSCGLIFQNPQHISTEIYDDEKYFRREILMRDAYLRFFTYRLAYINQHKPPPGRVLDIGCGLGYFLTAARESGWEPYGVEVSGYAADYANGLLGEKRVLHGTFEDADYPDNFFDVVHMSHCLEHFPRPDLVLRKVKRILKEDGILVVEVPNEENMRLRHLVADILRGHRHKPSYEEAIQHLYYFTKRSLQRLIENTGFRIRFIRIEGLGSPGRLDIRVRRKNWKIRLLTLFVKLNLDVLLGLGSSIVVLANKS